MKVKAKNILKKVSDETCFRKDKDNKTNIIPNENTKYNCRVLLQAQSVCHSMKVVYLIMIMMILFIILKYY